MPGQIGTAQQHFRRRRPVRPFGLAADRSSRPPIRSRDGRRRCRSAAPGRRIDEVEELVRRSITMTPEAQGRRRRLPGGGIVRGFPGWARSPGSLGRRPWAQPARRVRVARRWGGGGARPRGAVAPTAKLCAPCPPLAKTRTARRPSRRRYSPPRQTRPRRRRRKRRTQGSRRTAYSREILPGVADAAKNFAASALTNRRSSS